MNGQTVIIVLLGLIVAKLYPNFWLYPLIALAVLIVFFALRGSILWLSKNAMPVIYALLAILAVSFFAAFLTVISFARHLMGSSDKPFEFADKYYSALNWMMYLAIAATMVVLIIWIVEIVISMVKKITK